MGAFRAFSSKIAARDLYITLVFGLVETPNVAAGWAKTVDRSAANSPGVTGSFESRMPHGWLTNWYNYRVARL
jgi:hypothetical protein